MRRALYHAGVLFAGLLLGVAPLAAGAGREVERDVAFGLDAEGFSVRVDVDNNDGDVNATIVLVRGSRVAYYSAPAKVTAERVTARFGSLGELDYRFTPKPNGKVDCDGGEEGEAVFEGSFVFTGENGYVHIDAPSAEGTFQIDPAPKGCSQARLARRAVPYSPVYGGKGATLEAKAGSRGKGKTLEVTDFGEDKRGRRVVLVEGFLSEDREGVSVARGVQLITGSGAFRWNLERGIATLRPPAPFTGWATFTRRGNGRPGSWKGSLAMPVLGGDLVKLAGREFRAALHKGVQQPR
jgi:hypothetical protein